MHVLPIGAIIYKRTDPVHQRRLKQLVKSLRSRRERACFKT